jgi:predicted site-specific integrase-resolvase
MATNKVTVKDRLLTPRETAERLGISVMTLSIWRCRHRYNLVYTPIGRRIMYFESDVEKFARSRRINPATRRSGRAA